jgi:hypothetical protein
MRNLRRLNLRVLVQKIEMVFMHDMPPCRAVYNIRVGDDDVTIRA